MAIPDAARLVDRELREIFGSRLQSLIVYGAPSGEHAKPGAHGHTETPTRTMAVVERMTREDLRACAGRIAGWHAHGLARRLSAGVRCDPRRSRRRLGRESVCRLAARPGRRPAGVRSTGAQPPAASAGGVPRDPWPRRRVVRSHRPVGAGLCRAATKRRPARRAAVRRRCGGSPRGTDARRPRRGPHGHRRADRRPRVAVG
jgi:hypothetical protein